MYLYIFANKHIIALNENAYWTFSLLKKRNTILIILIFTQFELPTRSIQFD